MKGKQAILRYLETHRTFTAKDVATECGMTINCITKNAIDLERARKIVRVSKVWRTVTYRLATPEEQDGTARSCTNGIFQECRNSAAMKRVLMVWGESRGMTNLSAVEKMAELMQQMEENSPRVATLQYFLKQVAEKVEDAEKRNAELEARCAALAAELSAVDAIHNDAVFITDEHYEQCPPEVQKMIRSLAVLQIPAYQAFLAEVRAAAVDEVCLKISNAIINCYQDEQIGLDAAATICGDFAAQLRKGGAS